MYSQTTVKIWTVVTVLGKWLLFWVLPEAMFMSLCGLLKEELSGVGLKVWTMCLRCS